MKSVATAFINLRDFILWRFVMMCLVVMGVILFGLGFSYLRTAKKLENFILDLDPYVEFEFLGEAACEITFVHWRPKDYLEKVRHVEMEVCDDIWTYEFTLRHNVSSDLGYTGPPVCCTNIRKNNWFTDPCAPDNATACGGDDHDVYVSKEELVRKCVDCECKLSPGKRKKHEVGDYVDCWLSTVPSDRLREEYMCDRRQTLCAKLDDPAVLEENAHSSLLFERRRGRFFYLMGGLMGGISTVVLTIWSAVPNPYGVLPNPVAVRAEG